MKKISFLSLFISFFVIYSCNSPEKNTAETQEQTIIEQNNSEEIVSDRPADSKGKFLVKSAVVEFDSEVMGMKQNMVMFIENYGEQNLVEMKGDFMGMKTHNISIINDGFMYSIDMITKKGIKKPHKIENNPEDIDFTSLTAEVMKEFNMKKEGTELYLDKKCDKYSINHPLTKMKGYYLVWKGIPLKTDVTIAGMGMKMLAKKIDLEATIPADKFNIPEGVKITEESTDKMPVKTSKK